MADDLGQASLQLLVDLDQFKQGLNQARQLVQDTFNQGSLRRGVNVTGAADAPDRRNRARVTSDETRLTAAVRTQTTAYNQRNAAVQRSGQIAQRSGVQITGSLSRETRAINARTAAQERANRANRARVTTDRDRQIIPVRPDAAHLYRRETRQEYRRHQMEQRRFQAARRIDRLEHAGVDVRNLRRLLGEMTDYSNYNQFTNRWRNLKNQIALAARDQSFATADARTAQRNERTQRRLLNTYEGQRDSRRQLDDWIRRLQERQGERGLRPYSTSSLRDRLGEITRGYTGNRRIADPAERQRLLDENATRIRELRRDIAAQVRRIREDDRANRRQAREVAEGRRIGLQNVSPITGQRGNSPFGYAAPGSPAEAGKRLRRNLSWQRAGVIAARIREDQQAADARDADRARAQSNSEWFNRAMKAKRKREAAQRRAERMGGARSSIADQQALTDFSLNLPLAINRLKRQGGTTEALTALKNLQLPLQAAIGRGELGTARQLVRRAKLTLNSARDAAEERQQIIRNRRGAASNLGQRKRLSQYADNLPFTISNLKASGYKSSELDQLTAQLKDQLAQGLLGSADQLASQIKKKITEATTTQSGVLRNLTQQRSLTTNKNKVAKLALDKPTNLPAMQDLLRQYESAIAGGDATEIQRVSNALQNEYEKFATEKKARAKEKAATPRTATGPKSNALTGKKLRDAQAARRRQSASLQLQGADTRLLNSLIAEIENATFNEANQFKAADLISAFKEEAGRIKLEFEKAAKTSKDKTAADRALKQSAKGAARSGIRGGVALQGQLDRAKSSLTRLTDETLGKFTSDSIKEGVAKLQELFDNATAAMGEGKGAVAQSFLDQFSTKRSDLDTQLASAKRADARATAARNEQKRTTREANQKRTQNRSNFEDYTRRTNQIAALARKDGAQLDEINALRDKMFDAYDQGRIQDAKDFSSLLNKAVSDENNRLADIAAADKKAKKKSAEVKIRPPENALASKLASYRTNLARFQANGYLTDQELESFTAGIDQAQKLLDANKLDDVSPILNDLDLQRKGLDQQQIKKRPKRNPPLTAEQKAAKARSKLFSEAAGNALIGGAFPLLFGQGLGASAGGAIGGGLGGLLGGQFGFGGSLVGTFLGSQLDIGAEKAKALGDALKAPVDSFGALKDAALLSSSKVETLAESLIKAGRGAEAAVVIRNDIANQFQNPAKVKQAQADLSQNGRDVSRAQAQLGAGWTQFLAPGARAISRLLGAPSTSKGVTQAGYKEAVDQLGKKYGPQLGKDLMAKVEYQTLAGTLFKDFLGRTEETDAKRKKILDDAQKAGLTTSAQDKSKAELAAVRKRQARIDSLGFTSLFASIQGKTELALKSQLDQIEESRKNIPLLAPADQDAARREANLKRAELLSQLKELTPGSSNSLIEQFKAVSAEVARTSLYDQGAARSAIGRQVRARDQVQRGESITSYLSAYETASGMRDGSIETSITNVTQAANDLQTVINNFNWGALDQPPAAPPKAIQDLLNLQEVLQRNQTLQARATNGALIQGLSDGTLAYSTTNLAKGQENARTIFNNAVLGSEEQQKAAAQYSRFTNLIDSQAYKLTNYQAANQRIAIEAAAQRGVITGNASDQQDLYSLPPNARGAASVAADYRARIRSTQANITSLNAQLQEMRANGVETQDPKYQQTLKQRDNATAEAAALAKQGDAAVGDAMRQAATEAKQKLIEAADSIRSAYEGAYKYLTRGNQEKLERDARHEVNAAVSAGIFDHNKVSGLRGEKLLAAGNAARNIFRTEDNVARQAANGDFAAAQGGGGNPFGSLKDFNDSFSSATKTLGGSIDKLAEKNWNVNVSVDSKTGAYAVSTLG